MVISIAVLGYLLLPLRFLSGKAPKIYPWTHKPTLLRKAGRWSQGVSIPRAVAGSDFSLTRAKAGKPGSAETDRRRKLGLSDPAYEGCLLEATTVKQ